VTELFPDDKEAMEQSIRELRPQVDVLVVSMHAGIHITPSIIAMYQKEAGRAAIDAGADLVLQHHAHILKGIEVYKGKAIFYGLGNFALEHSKTHTSGKITSDTRYQNNLRRRNALREFYRIKPIPGWEKFNYHADARMTMIAKAYIKDKKIQKVTYLPAYINPEMEPEILSRRDPRAQQVFDYVIRISEEQDLKAGFAWDDDEVQITASETLASAVA
jgi:poly-gamma-glutamate synthesis protein (capsule biosynthesis protein)